MTEEKVSRELVPHPEWCDPALCDVFAEDDGTFLAFHECRLLDEYRGGGRADGLNLRLVQLTTTVGASGKVVGVESHVYVNAREDPCHLRLGELLPMAAALAKAVELLGLAPAVVEVVP